MTDVTAALLALVLLLPLILLLMLAVRMSSKGPIFYGQRRKGYANTEFTCWKFRSMVSDSQAALERHLAECPDAAREWAETHKLRNDPRITKVGAFLRKSSLDELPQLWNVLTGEMSIVGPRPIVHAEISKYGNSFRHYAAARPGITGLWQISGRSDLSYDRRVELDARYVSEWSFARDIAIMSLTVPRVLQQRGSC